MALLLLAGAVVYLNSLEVPFVFDDRDVIERNPSIRRIADAFFPPAADGLTTGGRPLVNVTLALNHALAGTDVRLYHATNLAIHLLAGLVLYALLRRLLPAVVGSPLAADRFDGPDSSRPCASAGPTTDRPIRFLSGKAARQHGRSVVDDMSPGAVGWHPAAWIGALLWILHPLQTAAVTYVAQRAESLVSLFLLLALYCFLRGAELADAARARAWQAAAVAAALFGVFCKEVMVVAPVLVLLCDRAFVAGSFGAAWRQRRGFYLALFATWLPLAWLVAGTAGRGGTAGLGVEVSSWHYALTQAWAIPHYLKLAFWPSPLVFDYGVELIREPAAVILPGLLVLAALAAAVVALVRFPRLGFALGGFFLVLAPSSSVVPVATQTIAEHRMYLALAAVTALAAAALFRWLGRAALPAGVALAVALGAATVLRNRDYASELGLWQDTQAKRPQNARAHAVIGRVLSEQGREEEALAAFSESLRLRPEQPTVLFNAGLSLSALGREAEAVRRYTEAVTLDPKYADARLNLGLLLLERGETAAALEQLGEAARLAPEQPETLGGWGSALAQSGRPDEAAAVFNRALALAPEPGVAAMLHFNLGNVSLQRGRPDEAARSFGEAVRLEPGNVAARFNFAVVLARLGRAGEAVAQLQAALRLEPGFTPARTLLAELQRGGVVPR